MATRSYAAGVNPLVVFRNDGELAIEFTTWQKDGADQKKITLGRYATEDVATAIADAAKRGIDADVSRGVDLTDELVTQHYHRAHALIVR